MHAVVIHHVDHKYGRWSSLSRADQWSLLQSFVTMSRSIPSMWLSFQAFHNQRWLIAEFWVCLSEEVVDIFLYHAQWCLCACRLQALTESTISCYSRLLLLYLGVWKHPENCCCQLLNNNCRYLNNCSFSFLCSCWDLSTVITQRLFFPHKFHILFRDSRVCFGAVLWFWRVQLVVNLLHIISSTTTAQNGAGGVSVTILVGLSQDYGPKPLQHSEY